MADGKGAVAQRKGRAGQPLTLRLAEQGINTAQDFSNVMSAIMTDLVAGRLAPNVANAMCNAGGKMLKAVEMQMKYGVASQDVPGRKVLVLAAPGREAAEAPAA